MAKQEQDSERGGETIRRLTRRQLLPAAALAAGSLAVAGRTDPLPPALSPAVAQLGPYLVPQLSFGDVSRGNPVPHSLPEEKKRQVGLTRETWKLELMADPEQPATLGRTFSAQNGSAFDFAALMQLAEKKSVRFPKVMTCLNLDRPLGMGIWEGVPLRELVWLTQPRENLRRLIYYGYHNDDPKQLFRGSLPMARVLEDPEGLPPVILCYKLNGQWLEPKRGGPVRMVIPEGYGFKNVKWITHVLLTNLYHANDTYALENNDIDSPLKSFAAVGTSPEVAKPNVRIPITGYAQAGISGLSKVQWWIQRSGETWPADDPYFTQAPWQEARILPPPEHWGGDLPNGAIPSGTFGFDERGKPLRWPMRLCKAEWAALLPGLPPGEYLIRCRSIDEHGQAQPMPRPFLKSGHCDIHAVRLTVKA